VAAFSPVAPRLVLCRRKHFVSPAALRFLVLSLGSLGRVLQRTWGNIGFMVDIYIYITTIMVYGVYKPIIYGFMVYDIMYIYIYYIRIIAIVNSFFIYWNCLYHLYMVLGDITEVLEMVSVFYVG
jgi:hypothetical protein